MQLPNICRSHQQYAPHRALPVFPVEFEFEEHSSLCQMMTNQPHPIYGNGLLLLQSFPIVCDSDVDGARLALSMNAAELTEKPLGYGFGSYAYRQSTLHFTTFFPNALHRNGLLANLYFSCAQRAWDISIQLGDK